MRQSRQHSLPLMMPCVRGPGACERVFAAKDPSSSAAPTPPSLPFPSPRSPRSLSGYLISTPRFCSLNPDPAHNTCDAPQEPEDDPAMVTADGLPPPPSDLAPFVTLPGTRAAATLAPPPPKATGAVARLLSGGGVWEGGRKGGAAAAAAAAAATPSSTTHNRPPLWVWEVLATSAPGAAGVAVAAADAASAAAYFGGAGGSGQAALAARVALLGAAVAAAPACLGGALAELAPGLVAPLWEEGEEVVEKGGG